MSSYHVALLQDYDMEPNSTTSWNSANMDNKSSQDHDTNQTLTNNHDSINDINHVLITHANKKYKIYQISN